MLVGARQAGFDVIGNVEWRNYYREKDAEGKNTFLTNNPGSFMKASPEDLSDAEVAAISGADLAMGHPECGNYSQLNTTNGHRPGYADKVHDPGDIPLFISMVARFKPRYFVMDDLPKSFIALPMSEYAKALPDYDLFPEWISNHGYGNIQINRRRMFMIGALKTERFTFVPGEFEHSRTIEDEIGDLIGRDEINALDDGTEPPPHSSNLPNHERHALDANCGPGNSMRFRGDHPTWRIVRDWFRLQKESTSFKYHSPDGNVKPKPGWYRLRWRGPSAVLDGGSGHMHPIRCTPLSIRERARVQGFPDDFVFYGMKLEADGTWRHDKNNKLIKQTGKAMPIQFCRYAARLIAANIRGDGPLPESTNRRVVKPDPHVSEAKSWYCANVGYSAQEEACRACWLSDACSIRRDKYGIGLGIKAPETAHEQKSHDPIKRSVPAIKAPDEAPRKRAVEPQERITYKKAVSNL